MFGIGDKTFFLLAVVGYGLSTAYSALLWQRGFRREDRLNYGLLAGAFGVHTLAMLARGFSYNRCPVTNLYEAVIFTAWALVACFLILGAWRRLRFLGAFAAPVVFGMGVFALFPELDAHGPDPEFISGWSSFHAALILLAYGALGLASVAGLMYLSQDHDLKLHKFRALASLLPPIQRLEWVTGRLMAGGFLLLTVGLGLGGWNLRQDGGGLSFWDAKVVWSLAVWLAYLVLLIVHWRFSLRGRRFAWSAVATYAFVLMTFWSTNLMSAIHQR